MRGGSDRGLPDKASCFRGCFVPTSRSGHAVAAIWPRRSFRVTIANPIPPARGTMKARLVIPVLAAAGIGLLGCDRVPTADRSPGRPSFITDGTLDGNAHPAVVLIIMDIAGKPAFRCSGTIIAPKLVLTAGHCAGEPGEFSGLRIFNEADVQHDPTYPNPGGPNTIERSEEHTSELQSRLHLVSRLLLASTRSSRCI